VAPTSGHGGVRLTEEGLRPPEAAPINYAHAAEVVDFRPTVHKRAQLIRAVEVDPRGGGRAGRASARKRRSERRGRTGLP